MMPTRNTEALIEWCTRHDLRAEEIIAEPPDCWRGTDGVMHYRFRRVLDPMLDGRGDLRWESVEVVTDDPLPPMWVMP